MDELIASIDGATIENEDKMDRAYLGYWSLSEEERAKVTGYETLQDLRTELLKAYVVKEYADTRIPHHKLLIGAYLGPVDYNEKTAQELADAHIDMVWRAGEYSVQGSEGKMADVWALLNEYGIGMFNHASFHQGTDGSLNDAPNLWLLEGCDEPNTGMFDDLAALGHTVKE